MNNNQGEHVHVHHQKQAALQDGLQGVKRVEKIIIIIIINLFKVDDKKNLQAVNLLQ